MQGWAGAKQNKFRICKHFGKGAGCRFGTSCKFFHGEVEPPSHDPPTDGERLEHLRTLGSEPGFPQAYIGNLPFNATPASVKAVMPNQGAGVVTVNLLFHPDGNMKGYGYVQFVDQAALAEACKFNKVLVMGDRQIKMEAKTGCADVQREKKELKQGGLQQTADEQAAAANVKNKHDDNQENGSFT